MVKILKQIYRTSRKENDLGFHFRIKTVKLRDAINSSFRKENLHKSKVRKSFERSSPRLRELGERVKIEVRKPKIQKRNREQKLQTLKM